MPEAPDAAAPPDLPDPAAPPGPVSSPGLVALLTEAGLSPELAAAAAEQLDNTASAELSADPWRLLAVPSVTPEQSDIFAQRILGSHARPGDPRRGRALVEWLLDRAGRDGHTAVPLMTVTSALSGMGVPDAADAVAAALDDGRVLRFHGERSLLAPARLAFDEDWLAQGLARLIGTAEQLGTPDQLARAVADLEPDHAAAVTAAARHGVSVIVSGPGCGAAVAVAAIVRLAGEVARRVALVGPTDRTVGALRERVGHPAATLRRLVAAHSPANPIDAGVVIVAGAALLDVELTRSLVDALNDGVHLVLIGDPAELAPLRPGWVFGDLIRSSAVPVTALPLSPGPATGRRIAQLADGVSRGHLPPVDRKDHEVVVVPAADGQDAARRAVQLVTDAIPRALGISAGEVQVVTPLHRGAAGAAALNVALKERLNPGSGAYGGLDVGDRVVATASHLGVGLVSGDVGVVVAAGRDGLVLQLATSQVTLPKADVSDLRHGWAVTVHRAHGSTWPAAVAVLPGEASGVLSRALVYTAFTRGQRHLSVVHAAGPALLRVVTGGDQRPRLTRLAPLLRDAVASLAGTVDGSVNGI
jgi:exodeoxyribonuclease V alpha subunit